MTKRVVKYLVSAYAIVLAISFCYISLGMINYFTTIAFYGTTLLMLLLGLLSLRSLAVVNKRFSEFALFATSLILSLCLIDLGIRYVLKPESVLDYMEQNGSTYYTSLPLYQKFNFINKHLGRKYLIDWFHVNKPNSSRLIAKPDFVYESRFNSEGLRNAEINPVKDEKEIRLIALGDSYTEGIGSPSDSSWPVLLCGLLNKGKKSDSCYNVINAGASGSDPFFEYYLLKYRLLKYKPDIVMVAINASDIDDVIGRGGEERFQPDTTIRVKDSPWWEPVYGCSMIFRMFVRNVCHYDYMLIPAQKRPALRIEAIKKLATVVEEFDKLAKENDFKLVIILHPTLNELQLNNFELTPLKEFAAAKGNITVINLFSDYQNYFALNKTESIDYYWRRDFHHNPSGYCLWSMLVYQKLQECNLL